MIAGLAAWAALAGAASAVSAAPSPTTHTEAAMAATIHRLRGCLGGLSHGDRVLLAVRFGVGGRPVLTDAQTAARLSLTPAQVATRDAVAVRRLTIVHRLGGCRSTTGVATAASSSLATPTPALSVPRLHHSGGGLAIDEIVAIALIIVCVLVVGREFRNLMFPPVPR